MRILIVEDEHKIANALKRGLEQEHFAVDVVYDGQTGRAQALNDSYDLIILDRMLPGDKDGLEICRELRQHHIHTPVLILTARGEVTDRVNGLNHGADDYLVKPFAFNELLARIRALLRRPAQSIETVLTAADLSLNTLTFEVKRANQPITLSSKEYALLEYLLRNQNRIITKEMLISHVWDYDADILPNTVEVYIGYLRQKIDKPFSPPTLLHTIRGFGYQLKAS